MTVTGQTVEILDKRFRELSASRFKEFEAGLLRKKALFDRATKFEKSREKARREFLKSTGTNLANLDRERAKELRAQTQELREFLDEFKPGAVKRPGKGAGDAKDSAVRSATLADAGHLVLPPFASSIFVGNINAFPIDPGDTGSGAINSGWVFPDDPAKIHIMDSGQADVWCFQAVGGSDDPEFAVNFGFVPASTATYEMTAILAFHGFYILRSDDGFFTCKSAEVKLTVQMNVNQYTDIGWKSFPALIDRQESNVEEVTTYDRTQFFDYTTVLKAGDPVVVTVKGTVHATARGSGAYGELNFQAGTANYIQPLFLSVLQT
jgi:hypothetical protein